MVTDWQKSHLGHVPRAGAWCYFHVQPFPWHARARAAGVAYTSGIYHFGGKLQVTKSI